MTMDTLPPDQIVATMIQSHVVARCVPVVAEAGDDEEILYAEVDPAAVREWRQAFPALTDRRL